MNKKIGRVGSLVNLFSVTGFAICDFLDGIFGLNKLCYGSFFFSMFIAFSFVIMVCAFFHDASDEKKVSGIAAVAFAGIYATIILIVYFAQLTVIRLDALENQALKLLKFDQMSLMFNYDLLGYGIMAVSTFFIGLTIRTENKSDKWLKWLLIVHGAFFPACLLMPIMGVFAVPGQVEASNAKGGAIALLFWCLYFMPIGFLSFKYFGKNQKQKE